MTLRPVLPLDQVDVSALTRQPTYTTKRTTEAKAIIAILQDKAEFRRRVGPTLAGGSAPRTATIIDRNSAQFGKEMQRVRFIQANLRRDFNSADGRTRVTVDGVRRMMCVYVSNHISGYAKSAPYVRSKMQELFSVSARYTDLFTVDVLPWSAIFVFAKSVGKAAVTLFPSPKRGQATPLAPDMLDDLWAWTLSPGNYTLFRLSIATLASILCHTGARSGEGTTLGLTRSDIRMFTHGSATYLDITLPRQKVSDDPTTVRIREVVGIGAICGVTAYRVWIEALEAIGYWQSPAEYASRPLFPRIMTNEVNPGALLSQVVFSHELRMGLLCCREGADFFQGQKSNYSGHSPRVGYAVFCMAQGIDPDVVNLTARWTTEDSAMRLRYARASTAPADTIAAALEEYIHDAVPTPRHTAPLAAKRAQLAAQRAALAHSTA